VSEPIYSACAAVNRGILKKEKGISAFRRTIADAADREQVAREKCAIHKGFCSVCGPAR
jgi:hypothetical protein